MLEKQKNKTLNYFNEIKKILILYNENYDYFDTAFERTPFSPCFLNVDKMITQGILKYRGTSVNFKNEINKSISLEVFLDFCSFFKTLISYSVYSPIDEYIEKIAKIIDYDIDKLNYDFYFDTNEQIFKTKLKNPIADATTTFPKPQTSDNIYSYLSFKKGEIDKKRMWLKTLSDEIEYLCKDEDKEIKNILSKAKHFIQCVRHSEDSDDLKKKFPFYYKDEEKWLDNTFEMIIGILAFNNLKKITKEIQNLEKGK